MAIYMCGFAGFFDRHLNGQEGSAILNKMGMAIQHRGPDDDGIWMAESLGVGLAHRRLSVIDLSNGGRQPMKSMSGRYVLAYNGEIYNYQSIRKELSQSGTKFNTSSDTEVLLAAVERWGLEKALNQFAGMFAFVLIDRRDNKLHLVRDRMGEKPLYYGWQGKTFLFGSELKCLRVHPSWKGGLRHDSVSHMFRYGYVPSPKTIHPDIYKLCPGSIVTISLQKNSEKKVMHSIWWSYEEVVANGMSDVRLQKKEDYKDELANLLSTVIVDQQIADVPLGAFLSGGIDSSLIASTMQENSTSPIRTFTIGYTESAYNESNIAEGVAESIGSQHRTWIITPKDVLGIIPHLSTIYDEPFGDSSQIPTTLLSKMVSTEVTVALSGDGGDELFGGYNRYRWAPLIKQTFGWLPKRLRRNIAALLNVLANNVTDAAQDRVHPFIPNSMRVPQWSEKLRKVAKVLPLNDEIEMYRALTTELLNDNLVKGLIDIGNGNELDDLWKLGDTFSQKMMNVDAATYLPDDILVKVDRASMASSLEVRAPFLDYRIVEFAAGLPISEKISGGKGKIILRKLLSSRVSDQLIERPKSGFSVPLDRWLQGPLKEWAEDLMSDQNLHRLGFVDVGIIRQMWQQHISGAQIHTNALWNILMFNSWYDSHEKL